LIGLESCLSLVNLKPPTRRLAISNRQLNCSRRSPVLLHLVIPYSLCGHHYNFCLSLSAVSCHSFLHPTCLSSPSVTVFTEVSSCCNIKGFSVWPQSLSFGVSIILRINRTVFVMETNCVFCGIGTEFLTTAQMNFMIQRLHRVDCNVSKPLAVIPSREAWICSSCNPGSEVDEQP
jgi:hypothetical protein